jgi:hypothetical protein
MSELLVQLLKRLTIWMLEILCQTLLGSLLLLEVARSYGPNRDAFAIELLRSFLAIVLFFVWGSGYVLSTAIAGVVWRSKQLWLYPVIAGILFLAHLQWLFTKIGGMSPSDRLIFHAGGVCIVLACTFTGNLLLRKWNTPRKSSNEQQLRPVT